MGAGKGSHPAAHRVKQHITAHQPAVGLRVCAKNHALVQHMNRLPGQIEQHNADHQPRQTVAQHAERQPGQHQQQQADTARHLP
ncbi:hypothetical protein D3C80_2043930 [compost metagenome]